MRVHTDVLTKNDLYRATKHLPGVSVALTQHGSRSRARAFEVRLTGNGYARNSGTYGADSTTHSATWDEWGAFLSALYETDPFAVWGSARYPTYRDAEDFHAVTLDRFRFKVTPGMLPYDTHKRHTWRWSSGAGQCLKCSARWAPGWAPGWATR